MLRYQMKRRGMCLRWLAKANLIMGGIFLASAVKPAQAGPFVDSLIVESKTFGPASQGAIEIFVSNDSAVTSIQLPLVIHSLSGGAFARIDSVKQLFTSPLPPGTRTPVFRAFVTNNSGLGTYAVDSGGPLLVIHTGGQPNVPFFVRGVETIGNQAPILRCSPGRTVYFGASVSLLPLEASDPEGDQLLFSLVGFSKIGGGGPPQNSPVVDVNTGRFFWQTVSNATEVGTWETTLGVWDPLSFSPVTCTFTIEVTDLRGDVNNDGLWSDVVDIIELINLVVFQTSITSENPNSADVNCSGVVDLEDIVALISFVVFGAPAPCRG